MGSRPVVVIWRLSVVSLVTAVLITGISNNLEASESFVTTDTGGTDRPHHDPILLEKDSDYTKKNGIRSGNGTYYNPYVIENWEIDAYNSNGISISGGYHFLIKNVYIKGNKLNKGIMLRDSQFFSIENCTIVACSEGVSFDQCYSRSMSNNTIVLCDTGFKATGSTGVLKDNKIAGNVVGIRLEDWSGMDILRNGIMYNLGNAIVADTVYGIEIQENLIGYANVGVLISNSLDVVITHNNFFNLSKGLVFDVGDNNVSLNLSYPLGGNFWDSYSGYDNMTGSGQNVSGSDGIGDTPFAAGINLTDHYPLMTRIAEPSWFIMDSSPPIVVVDRRIEGKSFGADDFHVCWWACDIESGIPELPKVTITGAPGDSFGVSHQSYGYSASSGSYGGWSFGEIWLYEASPGDYWLEITAKDGGGRSTVLSLGFEVSSGALTFTQQAAIAIAAAALIVVIVFGVVRMKRKTVHRIPPRQEGPGTG